MAKKCKTFRGIKRVKSKVQCYCYYCVGSKKFEKARNRARRKTELINEIKNIDHE